jgi:hypothetical protein
MYRCIVGGIKHDLSQTIAVTHVDENERAVIATPVHSASECDDLSVVLGSELSAGMCSVHDFPSVN